MENLLDCILCNLTAVRINKTRIEPGNKAEKTNLFFDDFLLTHFIIFVTYIHKLIKNK
jgi:hypothetical protein